MQPSRHTTKLALAVLNAALCVTLTPAPASAQQAESQYACYVPGSGTMYRIKQPNTPAKCGAAHMEFVISGGSDSKVAAVKGGGDGALPTNGQGAYDFSNPNGFLSAGAGVAGNIPASGPGDRFMWHATKLAIRAGRVLGNQWDDQNIGGLSVAFGVNTIASANSSVALGGSTTASADYATAMGQGTTASGLFSTAMGKGNTASGFAATAGGDGSVATANGSVAFGSAAQATGPSSVALGSGTKANGFASLAVGTNTTANGFISMAIGSGSVASGARSTALGTAANTNFREGAFVYGDASTGSLVSAMADNQFVVRAQRLWLGTNNAVTANAGRFLETSTGGYLTTGGAWVNSSDVNRKHRFEAVDGEQVLEKIAAMPVSTWTYRDEAGSVRHMGPTAQDFRVAFGLGDTDKAIATVDADGVSLAAVKALTQRTTELRRENDALRTALAGVNRRLADLESARR